MFSAEMTATVQAHEEDSRQQRERIKKKTRAMLAHTRGLEWRGCGCGVWVVYLYPMQWLVKQVMPLELVRFFHRKHFAHVTPVHAYFLYRATKLFSRLVFRFSFITFH